MYIPLFIFFRFQIRLQNNRGADFVYQSFVLPVLFLQPSGKHRLMRQDRSETLVIQLNRHIGKLFLQLVHKRDDAFHVLRILVIHLFGMSDNDTLYRFAPDIVQHKVHQLGRRDGGKPVRDNLHRVGHRDARALLSVIYCQYSAHNRRKNTNLFCIVLYIKLKKIPNVRIIMKRRGAKAQRINFRESKEYGAKALSVHFAISKK